jgi:hypothetical protein
MSCHETQHFLLQVCYVLSMLRLLSINLNSHWWRMDWEDLEWNCLDPMKAKRFICLCAELRLRHEGVCGWGGVDRRFLDVQNWPREQVLVFHNFREEVKEQWSKRMWTAATARPQQAKTHTHTDTLSAQTNVPVAVFQLLAVRFSYSRFPASDRLAGNRLSGLHFYLLFSVPSNKCC